MGQKVAILGASIKPERYSNMAFKMLREYGHEAIPVTPKFSKLDGQTAYPTLKEVPAEIDTLTMYVGPEISTRLKDEILATKPKRVIFNPGSENPALKAELEKIGVHTVEGCTLVLLKTKQFDKA